MMYVGNTLETTATVYTSANGVNVSDMGCESSDATVATAEIEPVSDTTAKLTISALKVGNTNITLTVGGVKAVCHVTVNEQASNGINATKATDLGITLSEGRIVASGAAHITAYNMNGQMAAKANGSSLCTAKLGRGVYVVVAATENGGRKTAKIVIK